MHEVKETTHLRDLWNEDQARGLEGNQLALLRYRSNLLGSDLRITNFGGGNTSSKFTLADPLTTATPIGLILRKPASGRGAAGTGLAGLVRARDERRVHGVDGDQVLQQLDRRVGHAATVAAAARRCRAGSCCGWSRSSSTSDVSSSLSRKDAARRLTATTSERRG